MGTYGHVVVLYLLEHHRCLHVLCQNMLYVSKKSCKSDEFRCFISRRLADCPLSKQLTDRLQSVLRWYSVGGALARRYDRLARFNCRIMSDHLALCLSMAFDWVALAGVVIVANLGADGIAEDPGAAHADI